MLLGSIRTESLERGYPITLSHSLLRGKTGIPIPAEPIQRPFLRRDFSARFFSSRSLGFAATRSILVSSLCGALCASVPPIAGSPYLRTFADDSLFVYSSKGTPARTVCNLLRELGTMLAPKNNLPPSRTRETTKRRRRNFCFLPPVPRRCSSYWNASNYTVKPSSEHFPRVSFVINQKFVPVAWTLNRIFGWNRKTTPNLTLERSPRVKNDPR